jgi:hypothetical protein
MKGLPTFDNFSFSLNRKRISSALLAPIEREGGVRPTEKTRREAGRGCRLTVLEPAVSHCQDPGHCFTSIRPLAVVYRGST